MLAKYRGKETIVVAIFSYSILKENENNSNEIDTFSMLSKEISIASIAPQETC
jgi:hypothetical protein